MSRVRKGIAKKVWVSFHGQWHLPSSLAAAQILSWLFSSRFTCKKHLNTSGEVDEWHENCDMNQSGFRPELLQNFPYK